MLIIHTKVGESQMAVTKKISDLRVGTKLKDDIYSPQGRLVLSRGTLLNWDHLKDLYSQGLQEVLLRTPGEAGVIDTYESPTRSVGDTMVELVERYQEMFESARNGQNPDPDMMADSINLLYREVLDCNNLVAHFRAFKGRGDFTAEHSVAVATIAMQIGLLLGYDEQSIKDLGTSALLHDLGKSQLSPELSAKTGSLSPREMEEMARHPVMGVNLLSPVYGANSRIGMGVLQHHERMDGSGYPFGRSGENIPEFARIIAVADMFDNSISVNNLSDYRAAEELAKAAFGQVDPLISRQFLEYLSNFYVGNIVKLNTGDLGEVVRIDTSEPTRPLVRVGEKYIDLRSSRSIIIEEVVGY